MIVVGSAAWLSFLCNSGPLLTPADHGAAAVCFHAQHGDEKEFPQSLSNMTTIQML